MISCRKTTSNTAKYGAVWMLSCLKTMLMEI